MASASVQAYASYLSLTLLYGTQASLAPGPIGKSEHTNEELVNILKAKGCIIPPRLEAAMLVIPRDLFVPKDRHREAFRRVHPRPRPACMPACMHACNALRLRLCLRLRANVT